MEVSLSEACRLLANGQVVAIPTETVYGLAASIHQPEAVNRIFSLKKRPANNPLIIHVPKAEAVAEFAAVLPDDFKLLADAFWPGPLTLVLPVRTKLISEQIRAGLETAAFRVPNHPLTLQILEEIGPLVMPSANLSGRPSATTRAHVETDFGPDFPVVDGGACSHGVESTILCQVGEKWQIARQGALAAEDFVQILGYQPEIASYQKEARPLCPGQLYRHYAPKAKLILTKQAKSCAGTIIGYSDRNYPLAEQLFVLGRSTHSEEVGENLYSVLRDLDLKGVSQAYVDIDVPLDGLWATILERLKKAAI